MMSVKRGWVQHSNTGGCQCSVVVFTVLCAPHQHYWGSCQRRMHSCTLWLVVPEEKERKGIGVFSVKLQLNGLACTREERDRCVYYVTCCDRVYGYGIEGEKGRGVGLIKRNGWISVWDSLICDVCQCETAQQCAWGGPSISGYCGRVAASGVHFFFFYWLVVTASFIHFLHAQSYCDFGGVFLFFIFIFFGIQCLVCSVFVFGLCCQF